MQPIYTMKATMTLFAGFMHSNCLTMPSSFVQTSAEYHLTVFYYFQFAKSFVCEHDEYNKGSY